MHANSIKSHEPETVVLFKSRIYIFHLVIQKHDMHMYDGSDYLVKVRIFQSKLVALKNMKPLDVLDSEFREHCNVELQGSIAVVNKKR